MSWETLAADSDYEIYNEFPYSIRKKSNGKILKESIDRQGYYSVHLNQKTYRKHRIVAQQFIPNPNNYKCVDHINRDRTDNRIENLRYVSYSENNFNKTSSCNIKYEFIDYEDEPDDLIIVTDYGKHEFEDYYYSPSENRFYFDNGVQYRVLHINYEKTGSAFVYTFTTEHKRVKIRFNRFKKLYDLI